MNLRKIERSVRSGSESFYNFSGIEVTTWHPNPKAMSSITSLNAAFIGADSVQIGLANFYWDGYLLSNQTLIHETYRCSEIRPTKMSYGFIGVL